MSITPRGMSIQEAYRSFRDGQFLVNRRYQRKLVWTLGEKQALIDSALNGYPIPLILLAERPGRDDGIKYEIIDGMQRLNAIFTFIETAYPVHAEYFDLDEFSRARQAAEARLFIPATGDIVKLDQKRCADLLDYQLAVTILPGFSEDAVNEVFGRINSSGRRLSSQEKRQAGVVSSFADLVRQLAAELRGDVSGDLLELAKMPEISIESKTTPQGYGIQAEQTFWCRNGVLSSRQLRESDDEDLIADIAASVLLGRPLARSKELLDELYDPTAPISAEVSASLSAYGEAKLASNLKGVFSILDTTVQAADPDPGALRRIVTGNGTASSIKTPFYAIFMALFDLIVRQQKSPGEPDRILRALRGVDAKLETARHYTTQEDRQRNIDVILGLIQGYFLEKEPPDLGHGPGLSLDFENSLRRSRIETTRYEMKQGLLDLTQVVTMTSP